MEEEFDIVVEQEEAVDITPELYDDFLKGDKGDTGDPGPANTLTIGTVEKGENPDATITGTSPNQVLNLVLPKGDTGDPGQDGADGYSPSASVSKSGTTATITITDKNGTTTAQVSDGTNGQDGYTPVKGVDYFTAADISGIESDILAQVNEFEIAVVQTLPTQDIDTHTIYFVPKQTAGQNDVYDEYIYINNAWEHIGSTEVDLTDYYNKTQTDTLLAAKQDNLVSGTNIKTINNQSVLGNGNINIEGNEVYISDDDTDIPASAKIFIDESEGTDAYSEVVNSLAGNEIAKAPSVHAVNEGLLDVYSTTEQRIGTWIDGKPLYRKTFDITTPSTANTNTVIQNTFVQNLDKVIDIRGIIHSTVYNTYAQDYIYYGYLINYNYSTNFNSTVYYDNGGSGGIRFKVSSDMVDTPATVIIEYTKTTDV